MISCQFHYTGYISKYMDFLVFIMKITIFCQKVKTFVGGFALMRPYRFTFRIRHLSTFTTLFRSISRSINKNHWLHAILVYLCINILTLYLNYSNYISTTIDFILCNDTLTFCFNFAYNGYHSYNTIQMQCLFTHIRHSLPSTQG